jgi:iron complex outermembrane receptor protein
MFLRGGVALSVLAGNGIAGAQTAATGQSAATAPVNLDIGAVTATGQTSQEDTIAATPGTAPYEAPSRTPLNVGQPTSMVSQQFINRATSPSETFDQLITLTPSVQNIQPNGPVAQQNYGESIRGFQYTQFNQTFDGLVLPGTTSTFAPQDAVYFTDHDIGQISVDRGPGTASTIGYATFGGTLAVQSKDPDQTMTFNPYVTLGSFRSQLYGLDLETGAQPSLGGGSGFVDLSDTASGAALTGTSTERKNVFLKWVQPLGPNTVLTGVAIVNRSYGHTPYGATLAQIHEYGEGYALNGDPDSQDFTGNNTDVYNTDFEYLNLVSSLGEGVTLNDTVYTDAYDHDGFAGADQNGSTCNINVATSTGCTPKTVGYINGKLVPVGQVPGLSGHNDFRDYGNVIRFDQTNQFGTLKAGFWFDYVSNSAFKVDADLSQIEGGTNVVPYTTTATGIPYTYDYSDTLTTLQPYVEADITIIPNLTLIPGIKYTSVSRNLNATYNKSTLVPANFRETYTDAQPSGEIKYRIMPGWSAYGQIADGFLAPPLSVLNVAQPTDVQPETTVNYQVGTTYQSTGLSASLDYYYIPFNNYITSTKVDGNTIYSNQGGAIFKGVEAEFTKTIAYGASLYANGTLNDATYNNGAQVEQTPRRTAALGGLYDANGLLQPHDDLFATLICKVVGPQYGSDAKKVDSYPIKTYDDTTASISYEFMFEPKKALTFSVNIDNLFNRTGIEGFSQTSGNGTPLFWAQPGRSVFFSLSGKFS